MRANRGAVVICARVYLQGRATKRPRWLLKPAASCGKPEQACDTLAVFPQIPLSSTTLVTDNLINEERLGSLSSHFLLRGTIFDRRWTDGWLDANGSTL